MTKPRIHSLESPIACKSNPGSHLESIGFGKISNSLKSKKIINKNRLESPKYTILQPNTIDSIRINRFLILKQSRNHHRIRS